ncbi:hypothetical protein M8C21_017465, partial [Ambrosia artemisiifolia]
PSLQASAADLTDNQDTKQRNDGTVDTTSDSRARILPDIVLQKGFGFMFWCNHDGRLRLWTGKSPKTMPTNRGTGLMDLLVMVARVPLKSTETTVFWLVRSYQKRTT